jgi:hypothetical protein
MPRKNMTVTHVSAAEPLDIPEFGIGDFIAMERTLSVGAEGYFALVETAEKDEKGGQMGRIIELTLFLAYVAARRAGLVPGGLTLNADILRKGFDTWGAGVTDFTMPEPEEEEGDEVDPTEAAGPAA